MRERSTATGMVFALALAGAACGHPEKGLVDRYFAAVNAQDNLTLSSMSLMPFKERVDSWTITQATEEQRVPVPLGELKAKAEEIDKSIEANKQAAREYRDANADDWDQVERLKPDASVPARLQPVKAKYDEFSQTERELRKDLNAAKASLGREKQNVAMSMTLPVEEIERQHGDLEGLAGEQVTKELDLSLTISGQAKPYRMTLRRYELKTGAGSTLPNRWVIYNLSPQG